MENHTLVWIDRKEAKIVAIRQDDAVHTTSVEASGVINLLRKHHHMGRPSKTDEHDFLLEIASVLKNASAILVVGPGEARTELTEFLGEKFPEISKLVWDTQPMDHPTDPELVAHGRAYFHAEERMR